MVKVERGEGLKIVCMLHTHTELSSVCVQLSFHFGTNVNRLKQLHSSVKMDPYSQSLTFSGTLKTHFLIQDNF